MGMFKKITGSSEQCAPLENSENAFIQIISSLLTAQDLRSKNKTFNEIEPGDELGTIKENTATLERRLENLSKLWKGKPN